MNTLTTGAFAVLVIALLFLGVLKLNKAEIGPACPVCGGVTIVSSEIAECQRCEGRFAFDIHGKLVVGH